MKATSFNSMGSALFWRALQQGGVIAIFLVRLVILARVLSPYDFGLMAIAVTAIGFILSLTNFGMIPALIQGKDVSEQQYNAAWTVRVTRASLVSFVVFALAPAIAALFNEPRSADIIRVLALRPLLDGLASIKVAKLNRDMQFRPLAILSVSQALVNTTVSVILAPTYGVWALVAGTLAGALAYLIISYIVAPYRPRISFDYNASQSLIRFGRWIFATSIVALIGQSMLRIVIARQLGAAELGLYYLAVSLAFLPADIAEQVVGEVAFPFYARLQTDVRQVAHAFRAILTSLATLLLPAYALLLVLAPSLVDTVLGPKWEGTVLIIQVLVLANIIGLLGDTIVPILKGTGRPDRLLLSNLAQSGVLIMSVWILAQRYGVVGAAMAWIPAIAASQIIVVISLYQIIRWPFAHMGVRLLAITAVSVTGATLAMTVDSLLGNLAGFIVAATVGLLTTGTLLWLIERQFRLGLFEGLAMAFPKAASLVGLSPDGFPSGNLKRNQSTAASSKNSGW